MPEQREQSRVEWRVSWTMWPFAWPVPHHTERVTEDEADARDQLEGLKSMLADHELRPCERRVVFDEAWEAVS